MKVIKENKNKIEKSKRINFLKILNILLILILLGLVAFLGFYYYEKEYKEPKYDYFTENIYQNNLSIYEKEKVKYDKILQEDTLEDIYQYFYANIMQGESYPSVVMEYIFRNTYSKATYKEKFDMFYIFYLNQINLEKVYYNYLNMDSIVEFFNLEYNGYDWKSFKDLDKIKRTDISNLLIAMMSNDLSFINNYPEFKVNYNWQGFIDRNKDILDKDYINFITLEAKSDELIINPNMTNYNSLASIWYIHNYEDFIKNAENDALKMSAQQIYEQNLALFLGQYANNGQEYYVEEGSNIVSNSFISAYETYIELYPNDSTTKLIKKALEICYEFNGSDSVDIVEELNVLCYEFIEDAKWLPLSPSNEGLGMTSETTTIYQ